jgi:serine O-acetyltransferase
MSPLQADIRRYRSDFPSRDLSVVKLLARRVTLQVIAVYRLGQWLRSRSQPVRLCLSPIQWLIYVPLDHLLGRAYGIRLHASADIGPGLYIGHGGGIEVRNCTIGAHCSIAQQTTIGPAAPGERGPVIGSRVWIGAHARVTGPITVGHGATIAAGAHVSKDVPPGSLAAGNPARLVRWFYDNADILGDPTGRTLSALLTRKDC